MEGDAVSRGRKTDRRHLPLSHDELRLLADQAREASEPRVRPRTPAAGRDRNRPIPGSLIAGPAAAVLSLLILQLCHQHIAPTLPLMPDAADGSALPFPGIRANLPLFAGYTGFIAAMVSCLLCGLVSGRGFGRPAGALATAAVVLAGHLAYPVIHTGFQVYPGAGGLVLMLPFGAVWLGAIVGTFEAKVLTF